jgi:hypothetical protein
MPEHYTKNTVSATFWCKPCGKPTEHLVQGGKRGACKVCLAKLDAEKAAREAEPPRPAQAQQIGLFGKAAE